MPEFDAFALQDNFVVTQRDKGKVMGVGAKRYERKRRDEMRRGEEIFAIEIDADGCGTRSVSRRRRLKLAERREKAKRSRGPRKGSETEHEGQSKTSLGLVYMQDGPHTLWLFENIESKVILRSMWSTGRGTYTRQMEAVKTRKGTRGSRDDSENTRRRGERE